MDRESSKYDILHGTLLAHLYFISTDVYVFGQSQAEMMAEAVERLERRSEIVHR